MIGRLHHLIVDCPDPEALAEFWSQLLGLPVTYRSADFVVVSRDEQTSGLAFQLDESNAPPAELAGPRRSRQQMHLDVMVDDLAAADAAVTALGARPMGGDHVYADPAGHPFCLIRRPSWDARRSIA